jgi:Flp pilus assembly pilin Flp
LLTLQLCVIFVLSMRMPFAYRSIRGQTTLEYLLLLAVVAVVVIASFGPGSLVSQIHDSAQGYYNTVTNVIMGASPQPINGGWCPVTSPSGFGPTVMYRSCECPAPAFGGAYCQGSSAVTTGATACGPCPTGQQCLPPDGHCGCADGLTCGQSGDGTPPGSIPSTDCTQCLCMAGWYFDQSANPPACVKYCPDPCTTFSNGTCAPVDCSSIPNSTCNSNCPIKDECACDQYSYFSNGACVYCSASCSGCPNGQCTATCNTGSQCTSPPSSSNGSPCPLQATSCQPLTGPGSGGCPKNMWCNGLNNSCQCDCNSDGSFCTFWNGNACVPCGGSGQPSCCTPKNPCLTASNGTSLPNGCGIDDCGGNCGANGGGCPNGQTCSSSTGPGTCVSSCSACQTWNGSACVSTTPCGSNTCGFDSCGNACGSNNGGCSSGEPCSSSSATLPGLCCLSCQHLASGACVNNTICGGNNNCGTDSCGNNCGTCPPTGQPTLTTCTSSTSGAPGQCV